MQAEKSSRIDITELKAQMLKKIGPERFKRYFYYLSRFINQKLNKVEFGKLCDQTVGRENLPLHNQIIKSILKNACNAKTPPPVHEVGPTKPAIAAGKSLQVVEDGHGQGEFVQNQSLSVPIWSNGVALPMSLRKGRSVIRDRKLKDRPSPLGLNVKADSASNQSTATDDSGGKTVENGYLIPCDYQRPVHHLQGFAEQPENEERQATKKSADVPGSLRGKDQNYAPVLESGEEVEQGSRLNSARSPLVAPLGVPACSASVSGTRKRLPETSICIPGCYDSGGLPDTEMLRKRMEQIAAEQGLGGVTLQCTNALNNMLDVYLKRLIRSCVELVGARPASNSTKYLAQKRQKLVNGIWPSNHLHMQSGDGTVKEQRSNGYISLVDFKVTMELSPQQLGEDWPWLLEKILMQSFKE
ncbi:hypothetical protein Nepgr_013657 [Nepenthes gracilis]|uniref:Transcriptional coactivator Hfi1/Transcriptional adapter 1 n=1 Tax=Nepenthes gracilis TaxID=150966 RepID=A0AAD3SK60_NEPGR|nr:hypothetical protein Nepgr_013657 [Nepenthes gracilis]